MIPTYSFHNSPVHSGVDPRNSDRRSKGHLVLRYFKNQRPIAQIQ